MAQSLGCTLALALIVASSASGCVVKQEDSGANVKGGKCAASVEPTPGELGVLSFAHDRGSIGCMFGCGATEPLAARSKSRFAVYSEKELPPVSVGSSDPAVATFEITSSGRIAVTTGSPGTAKLEVKDASGALIDAFRVVVKNVSTIRTEMDSGLAIMTGGAVSVSLELADEDGCALMGLGGVDYQLTDGISKGEVTLAQLIVDFLLQPIISSTEESFTLTAETLGAGSVQISAPGGATITLPVEVVGEASVSRVAVDFQKQAPAGSSATAEASAFTNDDRRIHSPKCEWTLTPDSGAVAIKSFSRDTALVHSAAAAEAELTCTTAGIAGSTPVHFVEED